MMQLGDRLERQRDRRTLTQQEAAEQIGISLRSYQRYLAGGQPDIHNARLIARWLGERPTTVVRGH